MSLQIASTCVNCWACVDVCPNQAIYADSPHFLIDDLKCSECLGDHAEAQCAAICPVECAIVNELGEPLNPAGSLTGIPIPKLIELGLYQISAHGDADGDGQQEGSHGRCGQH